MAAILKALKSPSRASKMVYKVEWTICPLGDSDTATANSRTYRVLIFICDTFLYMHPAQSIDLSVFAHGEVTLHFHTFSCITIKTVSHF